VTNLNQDQYAKNDSPKSRRSDNLNPSFRSDNFIQKNEEIERINS
jgi:hypothetical protein